MLPLFEQAGGGTLKRVIDRVSALPERATDLEEYVFHTSKDSVKGVRL